MGACSPHRGRLRVDGRRRCSGDAFGAGASGVAPFQGWSGWFELEVYEMSVPRTVRRSWRTTPMQAVVLSVVAHETGQPQSAYVMDAVDRRLAESVGSRAGIEAFKGELRRRYDAGELTYRDVTLAQLWCNEHLGGISVMS